MKKYYNVSFKYSESTYCANIAHADSVEAVEAHYSKYEWVKVTETKEYEVETARRKGMPIVEIETEEQEEEKTMLFENIAAEVREDAAKAVERTTKRIEESKGRFEALRNESTVTRWEQFKTGRITEQEAKAFAIKRATKRIEKETAATLERLERIAAAPDLDYISIVVEWKRSSTWGMNPTAHANTDHERATGTASGCGYDKESAAIGEALNQCDSVLKALYMYKEKQLAAGKTDASLTACTGRDNRYIIAYGAGYSALPYFEGGVGSNCFWNIFGLLGFKMKYTNGGKYNDYYTLERQTA